MLDVTAWIQRVSTFLRSLTRLPGAINIADNIEPPAAREFDLEWLTSGDCDIPQEIRRFIISGSVRCAFHYDWTPSSEYLKPLAELFGDRAIVSGGGDLCELANYRFSPDRAAIEAMSGFHPPNSNNVELEKSQLRIPIAKLQDGAGISLSMSSATIRPVVYVEKIGMPPNRVLSQSFEQFLLDWEKTCYTKLEMGNLAPWLDPVTGQFSPNPRKTLAFRRLLALE